MTHAPAHKAHNKKIMELGKNLASPLNTHTVISLSPDSPHMSTSLTPTVTSTSPWLFVIFLAKSSSVCAGGVWGMQDL